MNSVASPTDQSGTIGLLYPVGTGGKDPGGMTENDATIGKWVWGNYQGAKRWKFQGEYKESEENWNYWDQKQWKYQRAAHLTQATVDKVFPTIETFIGHFTDNLPASIARSRNPNERRVGEMATKLFNWVNDINGIPSLMELVLRSSCVTGFSCLINEWDWTKDGKRGAPRIEFYDEEYVFLAPWTKNPDLSDCRYLIIAMNLPCEVVKQTYPKRADDIKPGAWDGTLTPQFSQQSSGMGESLIFPSGNSAQTRGAKSDQQSGGDLCTVIRQWYRNDDGTLRYTVCVNAIVVEDGLCPYEDNAYPVSIFNVIRNKKSAYGHSLVRWMKNLQDIINQLASLMVDAQRYNANSPIVMTVAEQEENKNLTNAPDSVMIEHAQGNIRVLTKPGASPEFLNILGWVVENLNQQTGNVDILRGEQPASVTTLGAMEILRDEANVLVKKMGVQVLEAKKRVDILTLSRLKQFLKDERTVRISGKGGQEHITVNKRVALDVDGSWIVANTIPDDFEADIDLTPMPPGGMQAKFERSLQMVNTMGEDGLPLMTRQGFYEYNEEDPEFTAQEMERIAEMQEAQAQAAKAEEAAAAGEPVEEEMGPEEIRQRAMQVLGGL